jgi:hypothetical protein
VEKKLDKLTREQALAWGWQPSGIGEGGWRKE